MYKKSNRLLLTNVSAGRLGGLSWSEPYGSGFNSLFGRDRSDPAAHVKHYAF